MTTTPNVIYTNSLNIGIVSSDSRQESQITTVEGADDPCIVPKSPVTIFTGCLTTHEMKQCGVTYRLAILRYTCGDNNAANADFYVIKDDGLHRLENANRDQVNTLSADFSVDCNNCTVTDRANGTTYCFDFVYARFTAK